MKKIFVIVLNLLFVTSVAMSQGSEKSKVYLGLNTGLGQTFNGYRLDSYNDFSFYEGDVHFTCGAYFSMFVTEKLRPRLEFRYSEMKYGVNWSDVYPDFDYTETKLSVINLNLNIDILMVNKNKFQIFASPGLVSEFAPKSLSRTYRADGTSSLTNYSVINPEDYYRSSTAGANFSFIAKYKINEYLGITATPGFNYYFQGFTSSNDKAYMKGLLNFGIEYTF